MFSSARSSLDSARAAFKSSCPLSLSLSVSLTHTLSRTSSRSSTNSATTTSSKSSSAKSSSASSSPRVQHIDLIVLTDTPPLVPARATTTTISSERPKLSRRDTPAYRSPRGEGVKRVEQKVGGWVGIIE